MSWLFGLIIFVVLIIVAVVLGPIVKGYLGKSKAFTALPEVAKQIGLEHQTDDRPGKFGKYLGTVNGVRVRVSPDIYGGMNLYFSEPRPVLLSTEKTMGGTPEEGTSRFTTDDVAFDETFVVKIASPEIAEQLRGNLALRQRLIQAATSTDKMNYFTVNDTGIVCSLNYGRPFFHYIPADVLEPMLTDLSNLVNELQQQFPKLPDEYEDDDD